MAGSKYVIGIDLGTTHTVVAYADTTQPQPVIQPFAIEQLVARGEVVARPVLPSARYHPAEGELPAGDLALPWASEESAVVGAFALSLGSKVPGRLVTSAKSWLSHSAVDRTADILPWGASEESDVPKVSPVEASASFLRHLRADWDRRFPKQPMHEQEVVLTVPASFDEAARALTLDAAKRAGLRVRLVEEPQAAFYRWLDQHRDELEDALGSVRLALVVDVGGGTTDLTLIRVELRDTGPRITRLAVGDHLMLGGDNMDLMLAKLAEAEVGKTLGPARFTQLVQQCRVAKERLLDEDAPESVNVTVLGSGRKLVGGAQSIAVQRAHVHQTVLDGFFPEVGVDEGPQRRRAGIVEFGLPFVADAGVTRHIAEFLSRHRDLARTAFETEDLRGAGASPSSHSIPDAVIFNGGVFRSALLRERVRSVLGGWRGDAPRLLENETPDLAVAHGAVAYGLARRGVGLRIGGGSARSYFLLVDRGKEGAQDGVCILPKGSEEGEEIPLRDRTFSLRLGRPVRFHLAATTSDVEHVSAGQVVAIDDPERYRDLPPIAAVLAGETDADEVPVTLVSALTEVGTIEMSCLHAEEPSRRWKLELQLRGAAARDVAAQKVTQLHPRFADATERVRLVFGKSKDEVAPKEIKRLRANLEKILGPREGWDTPLLRELFGALHSGMKRRRRSTDHERVWFHLVGYTLRPGFGYPLDEWRVTQIADGVLKGGVQFLPESQNWSEYWTMWRRIAGGLDEKRQRRIWDQIAWYLHPPTRKPRKRPPGPKALAYDDMVRLAGALERVPADEKAKVGGWLAQRLDGDDENVQTWWALGRLGARVPFYGSAHKVVPRHVASQWLALALTFDWRECAEAAFAATMLARRSGDRERDVEASLGEQVADRLILAGHPESWVTMVREVAHLDRADEKRIFGDSLPPGLRLVD